MADDTPTAPGALQIAPDRHRASCALNLAEWLRLGLRMQFPPVRPGQKSIPESAKNRRQVWFPSQPPKDCEAVLLLLPFAD